MTANDLEDAVIRPMLDMFPPPTHLRGNPRAIETALTVYRRALSRFDRPVLEQAFQKAAEENQFCMWPKCAAILAACEQLEKQAERATQGEEWVE